MDSAVVRFVRKIPLKRVFAVAAIALLSTACCAADGAEPVDAARNDASSDFACSPSALTAGVEWENSTCDADGNCTDDVYVHVYGCGRSGLYDCTPCWGAYDCTRVD